MEAKGGVAIPGALNKKSASKRGSGEEDEDVDSDEDEEEEGNSSSFVSQVEAMSISPYLGS